MVANIKSNCINSVLVYIRQVKNQNETSLIVMKINKNVTSFIVFQNSTLQFWRKKNRTKSSTNLCYTLTNHAHTLKMNNSNHDHFFATKT